MVIVGFFPQMADAESAGARLIAQGIPVKFEGALRRRTGIYLTVDDADAERAAAILDLPKFPEPDKKRFHACPKCGAADPIWYGKRKALILVVVTGAAIAVVRSGVSALTAVFAMIAVMSIVIVAGALIPEFECRNCHARFR